MYPDATVPNERAGLVGGGTDNTTHGMSAQ